MQEELFNYLAQYITLSDEEKDLFNQMNLFKNYPNGHLLLKEGQYAKEYYFVIKGCLRIYYLKDGEEKTVAFYLEEESISPESLTNNQPSAYYISCEEDSILLVASPDMEEEVFSKFPKFATLCRMLSEKELAKSQSSFANFMNSTPEERYIDLLKTRPNLFQRVPQYQIASYLGIKPESLSRIRRRLNQKEKSTS